MSFKDVLSASDDNFSIIGFNIGDNIFREIEDMIDDETDDFTDEAIELANEKLSEFVAAIRKKFGDSISSKMAIGPTEECIFEFKEGCLNREEWNFEEIYLYVVLKKEVDASALDEVFLGMEDYGFTAVFKDHEKDAYVRQMYDFGEYDTGYFSNGGKEYVDEDTEFNGYLETAEEMLA